MPFEDLCLDIVFSQKIHALVGLCLHFQSLPLIYRFTSIIGNKKYKEEKKVDRRQSGLLLSPLSSSNSSTWVYPKERNLCSNYRVQFKNKKHKPYLISTYAAEATVKAATKDKNDKLYHKIEHLDLIAKKSANSVIKSLLQDMRSVPVAVKKLINLRRALIPNGSSKK